MDNKVIEGLNIINRITKGGKATPSELAFANQVFVSVLSEYTKLYQVHSDFVDTSEKLVSAIVAQEGGKLSLMRSSWETF